MIIAIASDDGMNVAEHPGRCCGFVVFEVGSTGAVRVGYRSACIQNGEDGEAEGGSSSRMGACKLLVASLSDCGALVSRKMDDTLVGELQEGKIDAYACREESVDRVAELFARGQLQKIKAGAYREGRS